MKITLRVLTVLGIVIGVFSIAIAGLIFGSLYGYVEDTELVDIESMRLNLTSFVYVTDPDTGEVIEFEQLYDTENRVWVASADIPEHLKNAFVAIEDERFYSHNGIDLKRFIGAAFQYVTKAGDSSYGGSTITQQLIKNLTNDDDYSIKRKIQEAYRAINLEKELSKEEILEYYLNTIYLSQKCNGVGSAAQTYFGKDVSELSLAECATIAGITQFPTKYDPLVNPDNNKERQLVILKKMKDLGFITEKEYNEAVKEKLVFKKSNSGADKHYQSYFTDAVIDQVIADLMSEHGYTKDYASRLLYNGGLKIYISMDPKIQKSLDAVYNDPNAFPTASGSVQPQSSMVIMDPYTGLVKALCGGRGSKEGARTLNRATQTLRQPGSTIKPLSVYSPAIEYGLVTPSTIIDDSPVTFTEHSNWSPQNSGGGFMGKITVASALTHSRNIPAAKICNAVTVNASFNFLKNNYRISSLVERDKFIPAVSLGGLTYGVSVIDMCAAYCAFPNGGKYIEPSLYTKVVDSEDNVLLEHKAEEHIAISESTARDMVSMLTSAVNSGTGTSAKLSGMTVAGKTGTTNDNKDRWFVGFTPYYVGAVWFGFDEPAPLTGALVSGNAAARAWKQVMEPVHKDLEDIDFFKGTNDGKYTVMICSESGMHASPGCNNITSKNYSAGSVPRTLCTRHPYDFNEESIAEAVVDKDEEVPGITVDDDEPSDTPPSGSETPSTPPSPPADIPAIEGI